MWKKFIEWRTANEIDNAFVLILPFRNFIFQKLLS